MNLHFENDQRLATTAGPKVVGEASDISRLYLVAQSTRVVVLMDVLGTFSFKSVGSGTELVIEFDPTPKGVMKVLFPVLKPVIRRDLAKQHKKFGAFCESHHHSYKS